MVYKEYKMGPYNLHTIKTDKFKLVHMEVIFRNVAVKEDITKRKFLFDLLTDLNKEYNSKRNLVLRLEDLYNASLYSVTSKVGNLVITNLCMDFINPKYTEKEMLEESLKLPFEMIFNPNALNKSFDLKSFDIVKKRMEANIKSLKENPRKYAVIEALKTLPEGSKSSFTNIGSLTDLDLITPSSLYNYYEDVLSKDHVDIYIIGDLDMEEVNEIISAYAKFKVIKNEKLDYYINNTKRKLVKKSENYLYAQTNIVLILNLNNLTDYEKKYIANIYNIILGGGSLETKLYKKLRNEHSLCYNVGSMYQKYDGLILITTAVDINQENFAVKLIKESLKEMENNISDEEFNQAKELIISSLNMSMDNIGRVVDNYFYKNTSDLDDYETRIKEFKNIKKEDIYKFSKKVSISTIYSLVGGEKDEKN